MKLKVKFLDWTAGRPVAILHKDTALKLNFHVNDRILIKKGKKKTIAVTDTAEEIVNQGEIAVSSEIINYLKLKKSEKVEIGFVSKPRSIEFIKKKSNKKPLKQNEIKTIIKDIVNNALTESEIAYFISSAYHNGMSMKETYYLTKAMVDTGSKLNLRGKISDKHSIGGLAGNRTTPIVISICSAAGLKMPKTSSRAITSASGTADVIETLAKVDFSIKEIKKIVKKTGACLVWGGSLGLAPSDDKIIRVERSINLDPESQLISSIMSKKLAVCADYVLIDIPYGNTAKVNKKQALHLKKKFEYMAKKFKIKLKVVLTSGRQPIGNGIGPVMEMQDVLLVLKNSNNAPEDLRKKSIFLSGQLLELTKKSKKGKGEELAKEILISGKAFKKFKEIIKAQRGRIKKLKRAKYHKDLNAKYSRTIKEIHNKKTNTLARILGCPIDKTAGIYFHKAAGDKVKKGELLLTLYAASEDKLKDGLRYFRKNKIVK